MTRYLPIWLRGHTTEEMLEAQLLRARQDLLEASAQREYFAALEQMLQNRILRLAKLKTQGDVR